MRIHYRPPQNRRRAGAACRAAQLARALLARAAVPTDARAAPGAGRDRARSRATASDAAPAAGRRRQRQDRGGRARRAAGDGKRLSGGGDGADRDSGRAALRTNSRLGSPPLGVKVAWLSGNLPRKDKRARARRRSRRAPRRSRSARTRCSRRTSSSAGWVSRSSTSSIDSACASGSRCGSKGATAGAQRAAAPVDDERHADPAHAGDELLRRPRRVGDRRAAAGPHAGRDEAGRRRAARRGDRARARCVRGGQPGLLGMPADRRSPEVAAVCKTRASEHALQLRSARRTLSRTRRSGWCMGACRRRRKPR